MKFNSEQKLVQNMVKKFTVNELAPIVPDLDKKAEFPYKAIEKLAELGLLGITIPDKYGGAELDMISYCIIIEEISKVCASVGLSLIVNNSFIASPLIKYGTEEQKNKWLPKLATGETIGGFAFYEEKFLPGEDKINTIAITSENGKYNISGEKIFVVNGECAGIFMVIANLDGKPTAFMMQKENDLVIEKEKVLGMRSAGISKLKLNNFKVTDENILGAPGDGFKIVEEAVGFANIVIASQAVGIIQAALDEAVNYSKTRKQFGTSISKFQLVKDMITEIRIKLDSSRAMIAEALNTYEEKSDFYIPFSIAKLVASESAVFTGIKSVQVYGGYGYMKDYPIERFFRDSKIVQVFGETPLVQKNKLAESLLG